MSAFQAYQATVGTGPTVVAALPPGQYSVAVTNTGATAVFLSNATNVTTGTGAALPAGATWVLQVNAGTAGQTLYGIVASGTAVVTALTGA